MFSRLIRWHVLSMMLSSFPMSEAQSDSTASEARGFSKLTIPAGRSILTKMSPSDAISDRCASSWSLSRPSISPKRLLRMRR